MTGIFLDAVKVSTSAPSLLGWSTLIQRQAPNSSSGYMQQVSIIRISVAMEGRTTVFRSFGGVRSPMGTYVGGPSAGSRTRARAWQPVLHATSVGWLPFAIR